MKNTKKKLNSQSKVVKASFTGSNITKYSGLNSVAKYIGEKKIVPAYQYVCYASNYDLDAVGLHDLYKQRSTSEFCDERDQSKFILNWRAKKQNLHCKTWIEQV